MYAGSGEIDTEDTTGGVLEMTIVSDVLLPFISPSLGVTVHTTESPAIKPVLSVELVSGVDAELILQA